VVVRLPTARRRRPRRDAQRRADAQGPPQRRPRVLDRTGNLKAVQKLLGHASIQTTGDVYADWDIDQLARTMLDVLADDDA
jgi:integrase